MVETSAVRLARKEEHMELASKLTPVEKAYHLSNAGLRPVLNALMESCRLMLPTVRQQLAGTAEGDEMIHAAERALARAEQEMRKPQKGGLLQKHGYFGRIGNHYDFEVSVLSVQVKDQFIRCEGEDRQGRRMVVRVKKDDESFTAMQGDTIFFRGRIMSHRPLFGMPVTHIEVTSGVMKT